MAKVAVRLSSKIVVYAGDSLSADISGEPIWPDMAEAALPGVEHHNAAIGGYSLTQLNQNAATIVDSLLPAQGRAIHAVWIGTNDLGGQLGTGAQIYALMANYCAARRAAGWDVILVGTILPRSNVGLPETFEAQRQSFNTLIRSDHSFADALMDFAADTRMGDPGDELDTTYYKADRVHLALAGHVVIASIATPLIAGLV